MDQPRPYSPEKVRVLIIDDEPMNIDLVARALHRKYEVISSTSGPEALALLRGEAHCEPPDRVALIISDFRMPGMNGAEVLSESIATHPHTKRVVVTAYADTNNLVDSVNSGQIHYLLKKPWNTSELHHIVEHLIGCYQMERRNRDLLAQLQQKLRDREQMHVHNVDQHEKDLLNATRELERINRELEVLAYKDPLTGLYNHRAFQERLNEEFSRAKRYSQSLTLIYGDIDRFAELNRELGYQLGDEVLRRVATLFTGEESDARVRASDIVSRYGGEEFVLLLPETDKEGGRIKAERLQTAISRLTFPGGRPVTMSFGVASFPEDAGSADQLLAFAERAQKAAKGQGRDRVHTHLPQAMGSTPGIHKAINDFVEAPGEVSSSNRFRTYFEQMSSLVANLRRNRVASCLYIDLSPLRRIEIEYGVATHAEIFSMAGVILRQMRAELLGDQAILCRTHDDDAYLCVIDPVRERCIPAELSLEEVATRVEKRLNSGLAPGVHDLIRDFPRVTVGYSRVLNNSMMRTERLIARLVTESRESATLQRQRADQLNKTLLQDVILNERIYPVYQPIVHLESGSIFGYEALTRGPKGSHLESPATLFSVADEVDLTFELDRGCLRRCLGGAAGLAPVHRLFVNLLPMSFYDNAFIEHEVCSLLDSVQLQPANIVFEITEKLAIENFASFRTALSRYIDMGFGVAVDDVGTRHSNLESVMALHPNFIKVSDVLTRGAARSTVKREMLRSLKRIAQAIDAVVVAEGVETPDDLVVLHDLGIGYGQGFFLARPGPAFPVPADDVQKAILTLARSRREPLHGRAAEYDDHGEIREPVGMDNRIRRVVEEMARGSEELDVAAPQDWPTDALDSGVPTREIDDFEEATRPRFDLANAWQPLTPEEMSRADYPRGREADYVPDDVEAVEETAPVTNQDGRLLN